MFCLVMMTLATGGEVATERAELNVAMAAVKRLVAANLPVAGEKPEQAAVRAVMRRELENEVQYLETKRLSDVSMTEVVNQFQVVRDMVHTGVSMAVLPEEALCWERAGLNLATAHRRVLKRQVSVGVMPSQSLNQAEAQVARFEKRYRDVLVRCNAAK